MFVDSLRANPEISRELHSAAKWQGRAARWQMWAIAAPLLVGLLVFVALVAAFLLA